MRYFPFYFIIVLNLFQQLQAQTFTKVTTGPFVNSPGDSRSINWVDVNNDGFQDCMITNGPSGGQNNTLFINNGTGGFTALTNDSLVLDNKPSDGATWADSDNDGDMDAFVVNWYGVNNLFYVNNGTAGFTKINTGALVTDGGYSETASWGDCDNDGLVDLYVTNSGGTLQNFLYRNMGVSGFLKMTGGDPVTDALPSRCINWTDMDLDGDVDLFVTNEGNYDENIYRNDGNGAFTKLSSGPLLNDGKQSMSGSWGDYDNDGDLDVFVANNLSTNVLFRNDGNFNFTKISGDTVSKSSARSFSSAWSDVDNDGDLDLFVTNAFGPAVKRTCFFYFNNGNGSFSRASNHTLVLDSAWTYGCAFADYDNDGFEDLAVATCRFANVDAPDLLYHNDGNANKWVTLKLQGTLSNRAAIGAKVRLKATINGNAVWQLREISAQTSHCGQNDIRAHFGLGDAMQIDSLKIEWPSGIVQYSVNLSTNQFLTIVESGTPTALQEQKWTSKNFSVFPNPAKEQVTLFNDWGFLKGDRLFLNNQEGKQIFAHTVDREEKEILIDLRPYHLAPGSYTLICVSSRGKAAVRLLLK